MEGEVRGIGGVDVDGLAVGEGTGEDELREFGGHGGLDVALDGSRAEGRVVGVVEDDLGGGIRKDKVDVAFFETETDVLDGLVGDGA